MGVRIERVEVMSEQAFARFCFDLAMQNRLFHFDDRDEMLAGDLFTDKEKPVVSEIVETALEVFEDPFTFAVLAVHGANAISLEWGTEEQINAENSFFEMLRDDFGVDTEDGGDLSNYCLKATTQEMIEAGIAAISNDPVSPKEGEGDGPSL